MGTTVDILRRHRQQNKGITVVYNYLNLPIQVNLGSNDGIDWTYTLFRGHGKCRLTHSR